MLDPTTYRTIEGLSLDRIQTEVATLYERIFASKKDQITEKLRRKNLHCVVAEADGQIVGFKIGYDHGESSRRFYSWPGGVHPDYRSQGIGSELIRPQRAHCLNAEFLTIRSKTTNQRQGMLLLNIRHGFRIIGTYLDSRNEVKIILEKPLTN